MNYKIKCTTLELETLQKNLFESTDITLPNGSTKVEAPLGNEHYVFIDKKFIWTENVMAFEMMEDYKEVQVSDITVDMFKDVLVQDSDKDLSEFTRLTRAELVKELLSGKKLIGERFSKNCYIYFNNEEYVPFRFVDGTDDKPMSEGMWQGVNWRLFVPAKKMTIKEIEKELGYLVEIIEDEF